MAEFEIIRGGYINLELSGRSHRLYYEEAGEGVPLLCLHTAGSDTRQYRGVLNDPDVTKKFRVIAFDLPWHGKSSPPEGWQDQEYALTTAAYIEAILAVTQALRLEKPVVMGCSIGGRIVLHLALHHPKRFRALIGLESAASSDPHFDTAWTNRPDVHGGEICAAMVSGAVGPDCPSKDRWETLWHYMQSGPGVFRGDLHFYRTDGDMRADVGKIDTTKCPLYLLTGDYDYSASPADTRLVADAVSGAEFTEMKGLGHFPMSEDPRRFVEKFLMPVLESVLQHTRVDHLL
jgi:pimeloyl-ACP methyl ester carboxylesterase